MTPDPLHNPGPDPAPRRAAANPGRAVAASSARYPRLARVLAGYRAVALLGLNTLLLFVLVNLGLHLALTLRDRHYRFGGDNPALKYPEAALAKVYPDLPAGEWKALLAETYSRPVVYADYLAFRERPFQGRYVRVSEAGFREVADQGPWPPAATNLNVFVFGGSTMFGYGVKDDQTVSSYLQAAWARAKGRRVCVYNFGAGYYDSTQERLLFERLLTQGVQPDLAVFVDGLNEFWHLGDRPQFHEEMKAGFGHKTKVELAIAFLQELPLGRVARKLRREARRADAATTEQEVRTALETYRRNKGLVEAVCRGRGVTPVFVWQPIPAYHYDTRHHLFHLYPRDFEPHVRGYEAMERWFKAGQMGEDFVWCADLQENARECLYVDAHHYTARFSRQLATELCRQLEARGTLRALGLEPAPNRTGHCSLLTAHCSLFTAHCSLLTAHCSLLTAHCSLFTAHCSLFAAHCSLFTAHCSLFTAHCSLFTAHCSLFTAHCSLLTVHCSLLTVHCSLLTVHCSLLTPPLLPAQYHRRRRTSTPRSCPTSCLKTLTSLP